MSQALSVAAAYLTADFLERQLLTVSVRLQFLQTALRVFKLILSPLALSRRGFQSSLRIADLGLCLTQLGSQAVALAFKVRNRDGLSTKRFACFIKLRSSEYIISASSMGTDLALDETWIQRVRIYGCPGISISYHNKGDVHDAHRSSRRSCCLVSWSGTHQCLCAS